MGLSHFLFFNYNQLMKEKLRKYLTLFLSTLEISAFTFGGGFVIIPLMRKKFVFKRKMIDDEEMLDLTAIAQSAPGAIAVNASILVGYKIGGVLGALISILATVIPPFVIISVISSKSFVLLARRLKLSTIIVSPSRMKSNMACSCGLCIFFPLHISM